MRAELMQRLYEAFKQETRDNGSVCCFLTGDDYNLFSPLVHEAHGGPGGMLPDDFIWEHVMHAAGRLTYIDPDDWEDEISEVADSLVDVYNADLVRWLASNLTRGAWVDEAVQNMGDIKAKDFGIYKVIAWGQYEELYHIVSCVVRGINELAEEEEDADE